MTGIATRSIGDIDDLRRMARGADGEMVQIEPGQMQGSITHIGSDAIGLSMIRFSHGMRGRGVFSPNNVTFGISLAQRGSCLQWSQESSPSDLVISPAGMNHESVYRNGMALVAVSASAEFLANHFGHEGKLSDEAYWHRPHIVNLSDDRIERLRVSLLSLEAEMLQGPRAAAVYDDAFLQSRILEAFSDCFIQADASETAAPALRAVAVVRAVEEFVEAAGARAIYIADLCAALRISRRSLHRAFVETLGIGPIDFLRKMRLRSVHAALKRSDPAITAIGDVAAEHGFHEFGRFSAYYRIQFGELPSETLRRRVLVVPGYRADTIS